VVCVCVCVCVRVMTLSEEISTLILMSHRNHNDFSGDGVGCNCCDWAQGGAPVNGSGR